MLTLPISVPVIITGWLLMLVISIFNGALRDKYYAKYTSELRAHQISTLTGFILLGLFMWFYTNLFPPDSLISAAYLGCFWMLLTLSFETLFFHFVSQHSWAEQMANYNIFKGRVWILIPIWLVAAPIIFHMIRSH